MTSYCFVCFDMQWPWTNNFLSPQEVLHHCNRGGRRYGSDRIQHKDPRHGKHVCPALVKHGKTMGNT